LLKITVIVLGIVVLAAAVVLIVAATKPDTFRLQRSTEIKASPDKIYPLIADFRRWTAWSPYEHRDPALRRTYSGAPGGKGAIYAWEGNKDVGAGRMEMTAATESSEIVLDLDFSRPFVAHNVVTFSLVPRNDTTTVTWAMQGPVPFFAKVIHVFINMDKMVGGDFDTGLANLKAVAERQE
jgi:hypothetical protein